MTGTLVNVFTVLLGSIIGLLINDKLPERYIKIVFQALGLFTLFIGFMMASKAQQLLYVVFSLVLGGITGEMLKLDVGMEKLTERMKAKFKMRHERFSEGLITAFLLFCMGSMTILGAFEEGLGNKPTLLFTKSVMDGFAAVALSAALGAGVIFSVVPLLLYQGALTLFAEYLGQYFSESIISELTATGGILLIGLGLNILDIKQIKVLNLLPALIYIVILGLIFF